MFLVAPHSQGGLPLEVLQGKPDDALGDLLLSTPSGVAPLGWPPSLVAPLVPAAFSVKRHGGQVASPEDGPLQPSSGHLTPSPTSFSSEDPPASGAAMLA